MPRPSSQTCGGNAGQEEDAVELRLELLHPVDGRPERAAFDPVLHLAAPGRRPPGSAQAKPSVQPPRARSLPRLNAKDGGSDPYPRQNVEVGSEAVRMQRAQAQPSQHEGRAALRHHTAGPGPRHLRAAAGPPEAEKRTLPQGAMSGGLESVLAAESGGDDRARFELLGWPAHDPEFLGGNCDFLGLPSRDGPNEVEPLRLGPVVLHDLLDDLRR